MKDKVYRYEGKTFLNKASLNQYINETKKNEMQSLGWEDQGY